MVYTTPRTLPVPRSCVNEEDIYHFELLFTLLEWVIPPPPQSSIMIWWRWWWFFFLILDFFCRDPHISFEEIQLLVERYRKTGPRKWISMDFLCLRLLTAGSDARLDVINHLLTHCPDCRVGTQLLNETRRDATPDDGNPQFVLPCLAQGCASLQLVPHEWFHICSLFFRRIET